MDHFWPHVPVSDGSPISMALQHETQIPPSPRRDPTCKGCIVPAAAPYRFDKTNEKYLYGEILRVNESVHAPIDPLFSSIAYTSSHSPNPARPRGRDKGLRPAVVLTARPIELELDETYVMLMATYTGIFRLAEFPSVLQLFCMPVSPHYEIQAGVEHVHTTPEWQKDHVWLLALPFSSLGEVFGRWKWQNPHGRFQHGCSFTVDEKTLSELAEIQGRKWDVWSMKSLAEEGYLEACYEEYETFKLQGYLRTRYREYSEKASFDSALPLNTRPESSSQTTFTGVHEHPEGGGNEHWPLLTDVDVQTALSQPQNPSPRRRFVFGTAPLLDLEAAGGESANVLHGIEDRATLEVPVDPHFLREDLHDANATSAERTCRELSNRRRAGLDNAMLTMTAQEISTVKCMVGSDATENNNTTIRAGSGSQGTMLQGLVSARTDEEAKDPEIVSTAIGKSAKKSRRKWSKLLALGAIRRNLT